MEDEDDDISDIIKDCTIVLRKRMSPDDTVPFMYAGHHFTDSERDKVSCISDHKGREPANDEILNIVRTKPKSFNTLVASLKVNRNYQLFEQVCGIVRNKNPGLLEQILCEVRRLDPGLLVDQMPKDKTAVDENGSRRLDSSVEVQQSVQTNMPKSSQETLDEDNKLQQAQANSTANLTSEQDERIVLDDYNSDLHLCIDSDGYGAEPLTDPPGFSCIWAGVKATHGVLRGRVFYEVKLVKELPIDCESERCNPDQHVFRVGWSLDNSSLQLGEEPDSYGFGSTGKASCSNDFLDYGETYGIGDVIGAFLDLESRPPCIFYTKNGCSMGVAKRLGGFQVGKRDQALFPHILTKNIRFEVNFGQESPWFIPDSGFLALMQCPVTDRIRGLKPPNKQSLCEVIMIIGLPGSGKTTWAIKKSKDNPKKRYNILGTDLLVDKMKVFGLKKKFYFNERWKQLNPKATKCFEKLLEIACKNKRNFIIDQTNVYASARKSKMSKFSEFIRRAAVIVPDNVELTRRSEKRTKETGKFVPEESIFKMKRNFILPWKKDDNFDSIEYVDLPEDKATLLVTAYNLECKLAQGENCEQCVGKESSQIQLTQSPLDSKQAYSLKESSETAEKSVAQTNQMIRSFSTPSAAEKTARDLLTRSHSASPAVHTCSSQIPSTSDTFEAKMSAAQKTQVIRSLSTPEKAVHERFTRSFSAFPIVHNCSSHIINTSDTFEDMELDDVDDKIITRLGEKLSNCSEHDKHLWELVFPHLELTVTMREKKSIRRSRETGVEFLEFLGDKKVTVNQLVEALKAAGLSEFCKILPHGTDKLQAEINTTEMMYQETSPRTFDCMKQSKCPSPNNRIKLGSVTLSENEEEKSTFKENDTSVTVPKAVSPENTAYTDISLLQYMSKASSLSPLADSDKGVSCINSCESQCPAELPKTDSKSIFGDAKSLPEREVIAATDDLPKLETKKM